MNVLVISAHPDDETFGCGGTLLKHKAESDKLFWLVATVPHEPVWSSDTIKKKAREVDRVAESYEMEKIFKLGLPAARIESIERADIIGEIFKVIKEVRPEIVYVVHGGDVHTDHRILFEVTCSVLKPYKMAELGVRKIICYETLSSTDAAPLQVYMAFIPNLYIDITSFIERKLDISPGCFNQ